MLNPLWLKTFKTLVDVGHFTKTADTLYMTQPGVSQHIRKLEDKCGHALIKRQGKGFELTEQGRLVYQYALKHAKAELDLLEHLNFDNPYSGQCQVSCSGSLALKLYPQILALQQEHPNLTICLEVAPNHKILSDVQSGNTSLGIVTDIPNTSLYQSKALGSEPLCLVVSNNYKHQPLTADFLYDCGLIDHPDAKHYLSLYLDFCQLPEIKDINIDELPRSGYINQINQILLPVAKGLGFTVLPKSAIDSFPNNQELHIVQTASPVEETLYLIEKRNRSLPKRYEILEELLIRTLSSN